MRTTSVQFQLDRGERLLWSGMPRQGVFLRPSDASAIPFSLVWSGFVIVWEVMAFRTEAPLFFKLWGAPFVLVGFYMLVARFWHDAWCRARTYYGVTTERVIIQRGGPSPSMKSLPLRTLSDLSLDVGSDGSGTITFGPAPSSKGVPLGTAWPGVTHAPAFDSIAGAKQVYDVIREAQRDEGRRVG